MKEKLLQIMSKADENTVLICGNILSYYQSGYEKFDSSICWGDFFNDIVSDDDFVCIVDNMQLLVKKA